MLKDFANESQDPSSYLASCSSCSTKVNIENAGILAHGIFITLHDKLKKLKAPKKPVIGFFHNHLFSFYIVSCGAKLCKLKECKISAIAKFGESFLKKSVGIRCESCYKFSNQF